VFQLLVTANVVPSSLILSALMKEATRTSETFLTVKTKRRHIKEDGIRLHSLPAVMANSNSSVTARNVYSGVTMEHSSSSLYLKECFQDNSANSIHT
jgi:hypothetical protein